MNFPWNRVFEHHRERHRGALFFSGFVLFLIVVTIGIIVGQTVGVAEFQEGIAYAAAILGVLSLVWIFQIIRRARARRRDRYKISPLSRDEIGKARSKLIKKQSF